MCGVPQTIYNSCRISFHSYSCCREAVPKTLLKTDDWFPYLKYYTITLLFSVIGFFLYMPSFSIYI